MKKRSNNFATTKDVDNLGKKIDYRINRLERKVDSGLNKLNNKLNKRIDFLHQDMIDSFKTVLEIIGDTNKRIDETNTRIDKALKRIDEQGRRIDEQGKRQDAILEELRSNRIVIGNHEQRLQNVEHKILSTV